MKYQRCESSTLLTTYYNIISDQNDKQSISYFNQASISLDKNGTWKLYLHKKEAKQARNTHKYTYSTLHFFQLS